MNISSLGKIIDVLNECNSKKYFVGGKSLNIIISRLNDLQNENRTILSNISRVLVDSEIEAKRKAI